MKTVFLRAAVILAMVALGQATLCAATRVRKVADDQPLEPVPPKADSMEPADSVEPAAPKAGPLGPMAPRVNGFGPVAPKVNGLGPVPPKANGLGPVAPKTNGVRPVAPKVNGRPSEMEDPLGYLKSTPPAFDGEAGPCPSCETCDTGCDSCDACGGSGCCLCGCIPGCAGIIGGAELVFLKPHLNNNMALQRTEAVGSDLCTVGQFFRFDYEVSPRFWLGAVGPHGFGVRTRYWFFDHASTSESATIGGDVTALKIPGVFNTAIAGTAFTGYSMTAFSNLRAYTLDAEAMQRAALGHWNVNLGAGLRHGSIAQSAGFFTHDNYGVRISGGFFDHSFHGFGPTVFAEMRRPFGSGGLAFVTNVRGSFLYGDVVEERRNLDRYGQVFRNQSFSRQGEKLSVGEMQVGIDWTREVGYCTKLVVQLLWEGQYWHGTGNALSNSGEDLGLMGFAVNLGIAR